MRWLRDLVAVLGIVVLGGGALYMQREQRRDEAVTNQAEAGLRRMDLEVKYRAASKSTELNARGWPVTIDPAWFEGDAPENPILDSDRPWVEVAGMSQCDLLHPPVRMAVDNSLAAFWYNPYQGVVRARVPVMVSDEQATRLYNRVNGTAIASIFARETPIPSMQSKPEPTKSAESTAASTEPEKPKTVFSIFGSSKKTSRSRN